MGDSRAPAPLRARRRARTGVHFEFAKANWNAAAFKVAIEDGIRSAHDAESTTTWVMSNHDVVRHASRYGLPQVPTTGYHELPNDWLLRDGTTYIEDRDLARAAVRRS
ncbi:hypothetical protein [Bifidobacterium animalis]|uniref:hypothetical protein n=1 Tax=Bifidobacterium animalis TaxID=28025 RepID=UPI0039EC9C42